VPGVARRQSFIQKAENMNQCMNCGGPVADDDPACTTCGLDRSLVIFGASAGDVDDDDPYFEDTDNEADDLNGEDDNSGDEEWE
jgi:hypothetical protein